MADRAAQITNSYDPSIKSSAHTFMKDRLRDLRIVYGGTESMRAAGELMLPQYAKETDEKYRVRKKEARLRRNMFRQSVDRITGRIFEVPTTLNPPGEAKELSPSAQLLSDDADRRGRSFDRCAKTIYQEALKMGLYHVLVEYPVVVANNLAEERAQQARPYLKLLEPEAVIRCYEDKDTGHIVHLAWEEVATEYDEQLGQEIEVRRIYERWPGRSVMYECRPPVAPLGNRSTVGKQGAIWVKKTDDNIVIPGTDPKRIMFHTLYAEKEEHMVGRTPLTEVKDLTIEHFQVCSEYRNALKHAMFPILVMTGIAQNEKGGQIVLGPETVLGSTSKDAKFEMLEHKGTALESGMKDLDSLEQKAEVYAGQLTKPSGDVKATTASINSAEVSSFAKDMAQELEDLLQKVIDDCALWIGEAEIGEVEVNMDFAVDLSDGDLAALREARAGGDISRQTYWRELTRRNVLARDFNAQDEERLLEEAETEAMEREQEAMRFAAQNDPRVILGTGGGGGGE